LESRAKELQAAHAGLELQVNRLTEALAQETSRRQAADQQTAELAKFRSDLEAELSKLRQDLDSSQKLLTSQKEGSDAEKSRLQSWINELQAEHGQAEAQLKRLSLSLAEETERRKGFEQQSTELTRRRSELEAELATNTRAQSQLGQELAEAKTRLQEQQEKSRADQASLEDRIQGLQTTKAEVELQVKRLTDALTWETERRLGAEHQSGEATRQRTQLETQLKDLQLQSDTLQKQLQSEQENANAEQSRLQAWIKELQAEHAEAREQLKRLADSLAQETRQRTQAEQQAGELGRRRAELEAELVQAKQARDQVQPALDEARKQLETHRQNLADQQSKFEAASRELDAVNKELTALRATSDRDSRELQKLNERLSTVEREKDEFAAQAGSAHELAASQEETIRSLEARARERQAEVDRIGSLLNAEIDRRRQEQSQAEALAKQVSELSARLADLLAGQQLWQQREAELQQRLRQQKDELDKSAAAASIQQTELSGLKNTIDDLQIIQSALCAQVRSLVAQRDEAIVKIQGLQRESETATQTILARNQESAALRHAVLDAARVANDITRERMHADCGSADGWKRLIATLLHTPLAITQRALVEEIIRSIDGWKNGKTAAANGSGFHVELPDLRNSDFNCAEVVECAFAAVRSDVSVNGANIRTSLVAPVPPFARGSAPHVHQLITMLSASIAEIGCAENLELEVSFNSSHNGNAGMQISILLKSASGAETLRHRLTALAEGDAALASVGQGGPELALASAWQLALAMGGSQSIESMADGKIQLQVSLPLLAVASGASESDSASLASAAQGV
jgi:chromosome segregation ATPase